LRPSLGALPRNARCESLTLHYYMGSPISCTALERSPELTTSLISILKGIRLDDPPHTTMASSPRSLTLLFHNLVLRTSSIEAILDEAAPCWRDSWSSIILNACASLRSDVVWQDVCTHGPGIIIDGGLRSELSLANTVLSCERQASVSKLLSQRKQDPFFKHWAEALKIGSSSQDPPIYFLPDELRLVHPKVSIYPRLESISLPVRGSSIIQITNNQSDLLWPSTEKLISTVMPNLKKLSFVGGGGNKGVGWAAGAFLRPEKIKFSHLLPSIEEIQYTNAELPRVHHSCSHLKPWEAVLLCSTSAYCLSHFVRPALRNKHCSLWKVTCIDLRIPSGLLIEEGVSTVSFINEEEEDGDEEGEVEEPLNSLNKSLWSVAVSDRSFLLTAPDGLDVEVVTIAMTKMRKA
jgi:hypothetical protein